MRLSLYLMSVLAQEIYLVVKSTCGGKIDIGDRLIVG